MSYSLKISRDDDGRRLDRTLRSKFKYVSLGEIMKAIRTGLIRVNSQKIREGSFHLSAGDEIITPWPLEESKNFHVQHKASWGKIKILFQCENVLIVNKPAGILVQPDEPNGDSIISRVWAMMNTKQAAAVHRLDRNTTGVLAVALHGDSLRALESLFKERRVRKFYLAIVAGKVQKDFVIDAPLLKDSENNLVKVSESGLSAMTKCEKIAGDNDYSLVKLELLTGRTHQARVHMSYIKHSILGDRKYGNFAVNHKLKNVNRPLLHAYELEFPENLHESLSEIAGKKFTAPIPDDMREFIEFRKWEIDL